MSPAVIFDGSVFWMWTVEVEQGKLQIFRRRSADGLEWPRTGELAKLDGLAAGREVWHLDVVQERGRLSAALVSCTQMGGAGSRLHYAYSEDGGLSWSASKFLFEQAYEFESRVQYRAALLLAGEEGGAFDLWYSAASQANVFSIAYQRVVRTGNELLPAERPSSAAETLTLLK
jgi:hypothetical protein